MRALLICPSERAEVAGLFQSHSLSMLPLFGQTLPEYWLSYLVVNGFKQVWVLAHEQVAEIRALTGTGARWGIEVEVLPQSRELTPAQALLKYGEELGITTIANRIFVLDHFPGKPGLPLFADAKSFFQGLQAWFSEALTPERVGYRQLEEGIFIGRKATIGKGAKLNAPCWIGANACVGRNVVLNSFSVVEEGSVLESYATVEASYVGPYTFIGRFTSVRGSLVCGNRLADWQTGSVVTVPDPFIIGALRKPAGRAGESWLTRAADVWSRKTESLMVWKQMVVKKEG